MESIKEAEAAEATELLRKCKFSKDIKDAPVHGDKYLIHEKTNEEKTEWRPEECETCSLAHCEHSAIISAGSSAICMHHIPKEAADAEKEPAD